MQRNLLRRGKDSRADPARSVSDLLTFWTASDAIELPFQVLLGRGPTVRERDDAAGDGIVATAHRLAATVEHARHVENAGDTGHVLAGSPAALAIHPTGSLSPCAAAVVGIGGKLILRGGSNAVLEQYRGRVATPPEWLDQWREVAERGRARAAAAGAAIVQLILPEALAVQADRFPGPSASLPLHLRPVERLIAAEPGILYPVEEILAAPGDAILVTDCHYAPLGAAATFTAVMHALGLVVHLEPPQLSEFMFIGDLGRKFGPRICEASVFPVLSSQTEIQEDNFGHNWRLGHVRGTYRVVENLRAPCDARVLVFGDSHSFPPPPGITGSFGDLLARSFTHVHHRWSPFGWDSRLVAEVQPDIIIQEIAERLIPRPPIEEARR